MNAALISTWDFHHMVSHFLTTPLAQSYVSVIRGPTIII